MTDVVNIGISGSELGPNIVVHALMNYYKRYRNIEGNKVAKLR